MKLKGRSKVAVVGDFKLLFRVPKASLVDAFMKYGDDTRADALKRIGHSGLDATKQDAARLPHADVVRAIQAASGGDAQVAQGLYEEHRYRGHKSLYLFDADLSKSPDPSSLTSDELNQAASSVLATLPRGKHNWSSLRLSFKTPEAFTLGKAQVVEIPYTYVGLVQVLDPATEYPEVHEDLRLGFIWLSVKHSWVVICARDEAIAHALAGIIEKATISQVRRITITKTLLQRINSIQRIRRATLRDPQTGTNRRYTNKNMAGDQLAMQELRKRDETDDRPACAYNEQLPDDTEFALGYSCGRGRMFFQRDLKVSQMRQWGPSKTTDVLSSYRELLKEQPTHALDQAAIDTLKGMPSQTRDAIKELTGALLTCKSTSAHSASLQSSLRDLHSHLGTRATTRFRIDCEDCQGITDLHCRNCKKMALALTDDSITCTSCKHDVELHEVECIEDHQSRVNSYDDLIELLPHTDLLDHISRLVTAASSLTFNTSEEFIYCTNGVLHLSTSSHPTIITLQDLDEYQTLLAHAPTEQDSASLLPVIAQYKEKCSEQTTENCAGCVKKRVQPHCYLRLLGLFDSTYTPHPHHGHEFGDYQRQVTYKNKKQQLVVMIKSSDTVRTLRMRQDVGRDIHSQCASYLDDAKIDIIGIMIPRPLEESFKANLRMRAQAAGKKLIFIDQHDVIRIVHNTIKARKTRVEHL